MTREGRRRVLILISAVWAMGIVFLFPSFGNATDDGKGNADRGKLVFEKRCTGCHSLNRNGEGPRLGNVFGRKAGSVSDFTYSEPVKSAPFAWDEQTLDRWLTNPDALIPDNDMAFRVSNAEERADVIKFLRISSGK